MTCPLSRALGLSLLLHVAGGVSYWSWERHPYPLPPSTRTPVTTLELVFIEDDALPPETILPSNLAKHVDEEPLKNRPLASPSPLDNPPIASDSAPPSPAIASAVINPAPVPFHPAEPIEPSPSSPPAARLGRSATAPPAVSDPAPKSEIAARPSYRSNPAPIYPVRALQRRWEGTVLLDITVEIRGQTAGVKVKESSGYGILDEAAVEAVRGWTFEPARLNDEAVRSQVEVPIRFYLTRPSLR